jgi:uncharacterized protein YprB with RNaseH-like and TPR domain
MDLLQRLAHARTLERLVGRVEPVGRAGHVGPVAPATEPTPVPPVPETTRTRVSSTSGFVRREVAISLALAPGGPRGFGVRMRDRPSLLGGCLERLDLPTPSRLAGDLVCLGAGQGTRAVFLDTETTGLGGAAVPFIVGLAWYEGETRGTAGRLMVAQWTLARLGGEAELLSDVLGTLRKLVPEPLVSFNGASFDLPLLRLRARRHGLCDRVLDAGHARPVDHVDLLHPARRLHKGRGRDCRLGTLEQDLLGLHRRGDIDSAEIPAVFWAWVNNQDDPVAQRRLQAVCEHNLVDLVSLPALANKLAGLIREPGDIDRARRSARHLCGRGDGRASERGSEREGEQQARLLLARWVEPGLEHGARRDASWRAAAMELANLERRAGAHERAGALWRAVWEADPGCPIAAETWAKQLEHGDRDFAEALRVARGSRLQCERRISRLERRIAAEQSAGQMAADRDGAIVVERREHVHVDVVVAKPEPAPRPSTSPVIRSSRSPGSSLLSVVEDRGGAKLRYRLLR